MTGRQAAIKVIKQLQGKGFQALLAGGCVRDMLLRRRAQDYDVATNAHPKEVISLFRRTLSVGAKFGVVIVLIDSRQVEVATFRTEAGYCDGRHPAQVKFSTASEDAARRDFTINGMFYDPIKKQLYDYVGGQKDLKEKILRTIGKPEERFSEDYLRMLRAVRFSTQLGFEIEPATFSAICRNSSSISKVSGERISIELEGILTNPNRGIGVALLIESGLLKSIFSALTSEQARVGLGVLKQLPKRAVFPLALACLFTGCQTQDAIEQCQKLKPSRNQIKLMRFLLDNRGRLLDKNMSLASLKRLLSEPFFYDLYIMQRAIQKSEGKSFAALNKLRRRIKEIGDMELKPKPLLNGHDLMKLGAKPGPALGRLAEELYTAQLEGEIHTPYEATQWVENWFNKHKKVAK
jgi:poly(A) polymerase